MRRRLCYHERFVSAANHRRGNRLRLDLTRFRRGGHVERRFEASECAGANPGSEFTVAAPVVLAFDIHRNDEEYRVTGRLSTTLELACSRCLECFERPVSAAFDLRYLPEATNAGAGDREVEADDLATAFYRDDAIDLGHLMREQFYLAMPMKPLCRASCRGLCPVCGTNINVSTCGCDVTWRDPRLEGLKALLEDRRSE